MDDLKGSQNSELDNLQQRSPKSEAESAQGPEESCDKYAAMRADLDRLEEEKYNLRSMQVLMKDLMRDLARHYDLSEKQVKFLSDSTMFDSLSLSTTTPLTTPARAANHFSLEILRDGEDLMRSLAGSELTEDLHGLRLDNSEWSRQLLQEMMVRVKDSNSCLTQTQTRLESQAATPRTDKAQLKVSSSEFVGLEAGRLELERARLEAELEVALQRIQDLETHGRLSLPRSDVIS